METFEIVEKPWRAQPVGARSRHLAT